MIPRDIKPISNCEWMLRSSNSRDGQIKFDNHNSSVNKTNAFKCTLICLNTYLIYKRTQVILKGTMKLANQINYYHKGFKYPGISDYVMTKTVNLFWKSYIPRMKYKRMLTLFDAMIG